MRCEQELGACTEPIERDEQQENEIAVVTPDVESANRHERVLEVGDEPDSLVEEPEVEAERPEAVESQCAESIEGGPPDQCEPAQ